MTAIKPPPMTDDQNEIISQIDAIFASQQKWIVHNRCMSKYVGNDKIKIYIRAGVNGWWQTAKWRQLVVLANVEVEESHQGQGILTALLDELEARYTCVGFELVHNTRLASYLHNRGYIATRYGSGTRSIEPDSFVKVKDTPERIDALRFPLGDGIYGEADDPPSRPLTGEDIDDDEKYEYEREQRYEREREKRLERELEERLQRQHEYEEYLRQQENEHRNF